MGYGKITKAEAERRAALFQQGIQVCGTCKRELPFSEFVKDSTKKSGLSGMCKACQKEQRARRKDKINAWLAANEDRVKQQQRQYYIDHAEDKRKYNQKHKEYFKQKRKEYEQENRNKVREQRHKSRHSLSTRYKKYQREAIDRNLYFELSIEEFEHITEQPCFYCGELPEDKFGNRFTGVDRIDTKQGYYLWNCVPCCAMCNVMKLHHPLDTWMQHLQKILKNMEATDGMHIATEMKGDRKMYAIVIHYCDQIQTLRLHENVTIKEAVKALRRAYRSDFIGCDLFELWQDDKLIYSKERPLCD